MWKSNRGEGRGKGENRGFGAMASAYNGSLWALTKLLGVHAPCPLSCLLMGGYSHWTTLILILLTYVIPERRVTLRGAATW